MPMGNQFTVYGKGRGFPTGLQQVPHSNARHSSLRTLPQRPLLLRIIRSLPIIIHVGKEIGFDICLFYILVFIGAVFPLFRFSQGKKKQD